MLVFLFVRGWNLESCTYRVSGNYEMKIFDLQSHPTARPRGSVATFLRSSGGGWIRLGTEGMW